MPLHLLTCSCGREIPVELSQAGEQLRCECGATVSVPTFRQLRELPQAVAEPTQVATPRTWSARQGAIAANVIIAALLLLGASANRFTEPTLPQFNPAARNQLVTTEIDKLSPAEAWKIWTENYRRLGRIGFVPIEHQLTQIIQQEIDQHRRVQLTLAGLAAIFTAIAAMFWLFGGRK
jgi:hypothetical protein